jgi:uncharacterized protein (TIGR02466 family)
MITYSLFPTAVAKFELGRDFTDKELAFVAEQPTYKNIGNTRSDDRYILKHKKMAKLREFVEASVGEYFLSIYAPNKEVGIRITQSWINYCKPGQFHHKHAHPNSFISGVLYMKAARERDKIYFYRDGYQQISPKSDNYNVYNSDAWWLEVNTGDLMLFPSGLTHSVAAVQEERISLSFNTFPVGFIGEENSLNALHLQA